MYGPGILDNRTLTELAYKHMMGIALNKSITVRWTNYTAHPSQTEGASQAHDWPGQTGEQGKLDMIKTVPTAH